MLVHVPPSSSWTQVLDFYLITFLALFSTLRNSNSLKRSNWLIPNMFVERFLVYCVLFHIDICTSRRMLGLVRGILAVRIICMLGYRYNPSALSNHDNLCLYGFWWFIMLFLLLQDGSVLMFDMRQTTGPVKFLKGLTSSRVHTIHSLLHKSTLASGARSVLSASSAGLCQWNFEGADEG